MRFRERPSTGSPGQPGLRPPGRGNTFYGWWIVAIGCLQEIVRGGTFNTGFTLYFLPILTELNLSRAATSLPFSLARLEAALEGPLVGYLIDRWGPRAIMVVGTGAAGVGFILLSYTHSYTFFVMVFLGLLTGGFQAGFNQATLATVNHWFRRKRALAMSLVQTGQAIGGVLLFPLVALAVFNLGWRTAAVLSGTLVLLLIPLVLLIRHAPESMGLLPDGETRPALPPAGVTGQPTYWPEEPVDMPAREALKTSSFWCLAAFHSLRNIPYGGVSVHLVPMLVWKGLDETSAAFFVGLMALGTTVIRPLTGWLGDRWSKQRIGALGVLLGAAGLGVLLVSNGARWHLVLFVLLFAWADGVNSATWALIGDFFGRRRFATIRGWIALTQSLATMPAAVCTGWVYDRTQSYAAILIPFMVCYGLSALALLRAAPPSRRPDS